MLAALDVIARPTLRPVRVESAPDIDGRLDDRVWADAPASDVFIQKFPDEGAAPSEATSVRILYDDRNVYVGIVCTQRDVPLVARLTRRDRQIEADRIAVDLDTRADGRSAFHFEVNVAGVLVDGVRYDDTELSLDWDEIWEAETARTADGWTAEIAIPLRILRFDDRPEQLWGLEVRRYLTARQEIDEWAYIPRDVGGEVSHYGRLGPLVGLGHGQALELRPFVVGELRRRDHQTGQVAAGTDVLGSAGIDLKWHLAPDLTLDATVLPDFGQVEADQVILNLTTFEIELPEKRPFFLEGADAFATPIQLVYTRRIGRKPPVPALPDGEELVDTPGPAPIFAAAKLVGRLGGAQVAALAALTGGGDVDTIDAGGARVSRLADPAAFDSALRVKLGLGDNGHVGFLGTTVMRFEDPAAHPPSGPGALCPDTTLVVSGGRCSHDAYLAGLDARWRTTGGAYVFVAQAALAGFVNGPPRALLDGTVIRPRDLAPAGTVAVVKEGGSWLFDTGFEAFGEKFDPNDLGFLERQNLLDLWLEGAYRDTRPGALTLESRQQIELYHRRSWEGLNLASGYQLNTRGRLKGFWEYFIELHYRAAHFDDREVGDGTALERDGLIGLEARLSTDPGRAVAAELNTQTQKLFDGFHFAADGKLTVRLLTELDVELLPQVTYDDGEPRYAGPGATAGTRSFGRLHAVSVGATARGTYTFTPRLTLQAYAQLFVASARYGDFTTFGGPPRSVVHLSDLAPGPPPPVDPDFEEAALNVNLVLRWEYRAGSTLFLVYTRAQTPTLALEPGQPPTLDVGAALRAPAADVGLVKLTYWWG